ncbi:beta amyloid binding protein [Pelomyxa schiedti]|nr:beta amyloid binding protein [Pelomyxa schiedti]
MCNAEESEEPYLGCQKYGPGVYANASCQVLEGIGCVGPRIFIVGNWECRRFSNKQFPTAIVLSLFLGFLGIDRFYLGHCGYGVFKMLTLGGLGVWWITDLFLLLLGKFGPEDGKEWEVCW